MVHLGNDWDGILAGEFQQEYYKKIRYWLKKEYAEQTIYPPMEDIFNALRYTAYQDVKAVILGQDPYHGPGQAHGLCFSVRPGVPQPPSLQNIFKELQSDLGIAPPRDGTLTRWAERGVLLLNTTLTVRRGQANSHKNLGWTTFTDHHHLFKQMIFLYGKFNVDRTDLFTGTRDNNFFDSADDFEKALVIEFAHIARFQPPVFSKSFSCGLGSVPITFHDRRRLHLNFIIGP